MEWQASWEGPRPRYLQRFDGLLRDARDGHFRRASKGSWQPAFAVRSRASVPTVRSQICTAIGAFHNVQSVRKTTLWKNTTQPCVLFCIIVTQFPLIVS